MNEIYLDNASTTPTSPGALKRFVTVSQGAWGNPHNTAHIHGRRAKAVLEESRQKAGQALGVDPKGIIFTSGATEANNLALRGADCLRNRRCALLVSTVEHACVDASARYIKQKGFPVHTVRVDRNGLLDLDHLTKLVNYHPVKLVSVLLVNNETGVIQPLEEIARITRKHGILLHTDAVQAIGKLPPDILQHADMFSMSGHKIHAPTGVGLLWVAPHVKLKPLLVGGGQEAGLRSGTSPVPLIASLAQAIAEAQDQGWIPNIELALRKLEGQISQAFPETVINGVGAPRVGTISNLCFPKPVLSKLRSVAASGGAACSCAKPKPSRVLLEMGRTNTYASNAVRLSASRINTPKEIAVAAQEIIEALSS